MTRLEPDGQTARIAAGASVELPERLSWPAAAAVIGVVSLALWGVIGLGVVWLFG